MERIFQNKEGTAFLDKGAFENRDLLERCIHDSQPQLETRPEIIVYGKKCKQHRNVGFFSDESSGYRYSNRIMKSIQLSAAMTEILDTVNRMLGSDFNGILVNQYIDGSDYISAHSDDEVGLDVIGVVSISYGSERTFRIRDKATKGVLCDVNMTHCSIVQMGGKFQALYTHEIPIQKKVKDSRISFTFRKHKNGF